MPTSLNHQPEVDHPKSPAIRWAADYPIYASDRCRISAVGERRKGPCMDGSGLAKKNFTSCRWSLRPRVRPHMMVSPSIVLVSLSESQETQGFDG
jgi:hypothetical protein